MEEYLIAFDDGHGIDTSGKRTPVLPTGLKSETGKNYMNENLFNRAVVKYLDEHLRRCGFKTLLVAPTDADTPLATRVKTANNAKVDAYVSIHANASTGQWGNAQGVETFVGASAKSKELANNVHNQLIKGTAQKNRGIKDGTHLYVIRNTVAPAILIECGFMDNLEEAKLLLSDDFRRECAREIAIGICATFGIKFVEVVDNKEEELTMSQYKELLGKIEALEKEVAKKSTANVVGDVFTDHKEGYEWAKRCGLTDGSNPRGTLTRQQFFTVLKRFHDNFMK